WARLPRWHALDRPQAGSHAFHAGRPAPGRRRSGRGCSMLTFDRRAFIAGSLTALGVRSARAGMAVTDSAGRKATLPDPVPRVMAAGPPASAVVYCLAPDKLIGWQRTPTPEERPYLLPSVHDLPELGRLTGRGDTANVEVVLKAKPDLIVDFGSEAPT